MRYRSSETNYHCRYRHKCISGCLLTANNVVVVVVVVVLPLFVGVWNFCCGFFLGLFFVCLFVVVVCLFCVFWGVFYFNFYWRILLIHVSMIVVRSV